MSVPFVSPYVALAVVLTGVLIAPLDTAVNVAFPAITGAFDLELPEIRWTVILYVLTYGCLMLVGGRLGDLYGYRRVYGAGLAVAAASFAACALAPGYELLLAARIGQGVGTALVLGCGPALALSLFPESERTRVLGYYASMFAVGTLLGLLAGGVLVAVFGWRSVFWMRLPLALAALALLHRVPAAPLHPGTRAFDAAGCMLLAVGTAAFVLALALPGGTRPWCALLALAAYVGFVVNESRVAEPIMRPALFRNLRFTVLNLLNIAANLAAFAVPLLGPYYFARVSGLDASGAGLQLGVWAGGTLAGAALAARLGRRYGLRRTGFFGVALCVAGLACVATWDARTGLIAAGAALIVQGFGVGLFQVAYADSVVATLPRKDRGVAGSLTMLTRVLGVVVGATLFTALFHQTESSAIAAGLPAGDAFIEGFRYVFRCAAAGLAACLVVSLVVSFVSSRDRDVGHAP
jgi:MFS family permease